MLVHTRDAGLLPVGLRTKTPRKLKQHITENQLRELVLDAFLDPKRESSAARMLQGVAREAIRSPLVPNPVRSLFGRAESADKRGRVQVVRNLLDKMADGLEYSDVEAEVEQLIRERQRILALFTGNVERIRGALEAADDETAALIDSLVRPPLEPSGEFLRPTATPSSAELPPQLEVHSPSVPDAETPPETPQAASRFGFIARLEECDHLLAEAGDGPPEAPGAVLAALLDSWRTQLDAKGSHDNLAGIAARWEKEAGAAVSRLEELRKESDARETALGLVDRHLQGKSRAEVEGAWIEACDLLAALAEEHQVAYGAQLAEIVDRSLAGVFDLLPRLQEEKQRRDEHAATVAEIARYEARIARLKAGLPIPADSEPEPGSPETPPPPPEPAPPPPSRPPPGPSPARIELSPKAGRSVTFPKSGYLTIDLPKVLDLVPGGTSRHCLPLPPALKGADGLPAARFEPGDEAGETARLNSAAATLLCYLGKRAVDSSNLEDQILAVRADVAEIGAASSEPRPYLMCVLGLWLVGVSPARTRRVGRRVVDNLLSAGDSEAVAEALTAAAGLAASSDFLSTVLAAASRVGLTEEILRIAVESEFEAREARRSWITAVSIAHASLPDSQAEALRESLWSIEGLDEAARDVVEDHLDEAATGHRGRHIAPPPRDLLRYRALDLVQQLTARVRELGKPDGDVRVAVSIPVSVIDRGLLLREGADSIAVPLLVSNSGSRGVGGTTITVLRRQGRSRRIRLGSIAIPWLSDSGLRNDSNILTTWDVRLASESTGRDKLELTIDTRWPGLESPRSDQLEVELVREGTAKVEAPALPATGEPVDLSDETILRLSSHTVRAAYTSILKPLAAGNAARWVVYGRRRRGKSSILRSLARSRAVRSRFVVVENVHDATRFRNPRQAFDLLTSLLHEGIASAGFDPPELPAYDHCTTHQEVSRTLQRWLKQADDSLKEEVRILLLIDEFQRWIAGLPSVSDRQLVLNALRSFNDQRMTRVEVSFVVAGLQSIRGFLDDLNDFANAVETAAIKDMTEAECEEYLKHYLAEFAVDVRGRRRLEKLSAGNPFLLNLLLHELTEHLAARGQSYFLPSDVDELIDQLADRESRVGRFLRYVLRQDESEDAPTLRQLTVLRAVASLLDERSDYDGVVTSREVENWLARNEVSFDEGLPQEHLGQLVDVDILNTSDRRHFGLRGEWMCRWLSAEGGAGGPLSDVLRSRDVDLVLGRYKKRRQMKKGGQATTWEAVNSEDPNSAAPVFLKIYGCDDFDGQEIARREREALAAVNSAYVVQLVDGGGGNDDQHGGVVVQELVDGRTLSHYLNDPDPPETARGILPGGELREQAALMHKLSEGVAAIHRAGVVHKDLNPSNILLARGQGRWVPKIVDFGISGRADDDAPGTTDLHTMGYTAPEKLDGNPRTEASDVFSLGMVGARLLTGARPEEGRQSVVRALDEWAARLPSHLRIGALLRTMLDERSANRPSAQSARETLHAALEEGTWQDAMSRAEDLYLEERPADAAAAYRRALSLVPESERRSDNYLKLLSDTTDAAEALGGCDWLDVLVDGWLVVARQEGAGVTWAGTWTKISDLVSQAAPESDELTWKLLEAVETDEVRPSYVCLVREFLGRDLFREADETAVWLAAAAYVAKDLVDPGEVMTYCLERAKVARTMHEDLNLAELWFRRVRRLGLADSASYQRAYEEFDQIARHTAQRRTLPENCATQDSNPAIGKKEAGHIDVPRVKRYVERVLDAFPFVCAVQREGKNPRLGGIVGNRPVLRAEGKGGRARRGDRREKLSLVLDPSYCRPSKDRDRVPIEMVILLPEGTTESQRSAAWRVLAASGGRLWEVPR